MARTRRGSGPPGRFPRFPLTTVPALDGPAYCADMDVSLNAVLGWLSVAVPVAFAVYVVGYAVRTLTRRGSLEKRYPVRGGGIGGAFDSVFAPSSLEAEAERDRQTRRTAPSPAPGDPPWNIDGQRIRIDL